MPRTYQWNIAVEQSLGSKQSLSVTYLGTLGRDLLRVYNVRPVRNPSIASAAVTSNLGESNYQAMQIQFQRRASNGLHALASYSWSHSIDNASDDSGAYTPGAVGSPRIDRGNSAFDVRHSLSGALTYDIPAPFQNKAVHMVLGGWSLTDLVVARTALPVDLTPDYSVVEAYPFYSRPDVVPGVPFYLYGSQYPGGKAFNPAAFKDSASGTQGNFGRNVLRGFGAWQDNFAVHRQFNLTERVHLQFRAEAFNLFNHPNFGDPSGYYPLSYSGFGQSYQTLASALSSSGLNSLYQIGGPRSWQFGFKLDF
jgi:hypothetical protein